MINDAKHHKFDLIITKEISRFSRNTLDSIKYTRELLSYGVAVLFLNDNINTIYQDSELRLTIMASMAQDEIRRLSERVKFGMHRSIEQGKILGNNKLYGYAKTKQNKLKIINKESEIIKRIFTLYTLNNLSLNKISNILNNENIKTNYNKKWTPETLSRMIKNPKYKGYYCSKKTEIINYMTKEIKYNEQSNWLTYKDYNKIPPIIEEELWNKANIKLNKNKKTKSTKQYLLTNKIYCLNDNYVYQRRTHCKEDIVWICSNYLINKKESCISPKLREQEILTILNDLIKLLNIDITKPITLLSKYYNSNITKYFHNNTNYIKELFIKNIFNKITVSSINNEIHLNMHLLNNISLPQKEYIFKRGYSTKYTKKYNIKYIVNYIFNN